MTQLYHRLGGLNKRDLFPTVLDMEVQDQDARRVRFSPWIANTAFSLCPHLAFSPRMKLESEREKALWSPFLEGH